MTRNQWRHNRRRRPKWMKELTKGEIAHIRETTDTGTLTQFKINAAFHVERRAENGNDPRIEPCWECKAIARKLHLPV